MNRGDIISKIGKLAESVAIRGGLEIDEVELKGSGRKQLLRVYIDKTDGVTHADCEFVSHELGALLDADELVPGSYDLEVRSTKIERKLRNWKHWERFTGQKAKVVLKQPVAGDLKHFDGVIARASVDDGGVRNVTVQLSDGRELTFPVEQVDRANLKFEW